MIGAILTQQTRWENVERALGNLHSAGICTLAGIAAADAGEIEQAIRCSGFYRVKARRLKALAAHIIGSYGGTGGMAPVPTPRLREDLLAVNGIGEETADSILCFGCSRPSFVIDAYTLRIAGCIGVAVKRDELKGLFECIICKDNAACRQAHAHIVEYAKEFCGKKRCNECILVNSNG